MPDPQSFLEFPASVRQRIFTYLLAPHPDHKETVINYTLRWNWLENPSNTTFGGVPQIDLCRCPRQKHRVKNTKTKDHMYTRYKCNGPEVRFQNGRGDLWVPSSGYASSGQINFLRPATEEELSRRPNANLLRTCRAVYEEAVPILYRQRNFLFITGPCPRGRYQAYATQTFFARLSRSARESITACSVNIVPHEEDCVSEDVGKAYKDFVTWTQQHLSSFRTLSVNLWNAHMTSTVKSFELLLRNENVTIELDRRQEDGWIEEIEDVYSFRSALSVTKSEKERNVGLDAATSSAVEISTVDLAAKPEALPDRWQDQGRNTLQTIHDEVEETNRPNLAPPSPTALEEEMDDVGWELI